MVLDVLRVEFGNFFYFLPIFWLLGSTIFSLWLCQKKGKKFAKIYILAILWINFALHFIKQVFPLNQTRWPYGLTDSLWPNLCAVFVFFAPFVFLSKNRYLKDYMYYLGVISAVAVYIYPNTALSKDIPGAMYVVETIRFYFCHWPLFTCSILMVAMGFHKLDWKRLWAIPLIYCAVLALISFQQILFGPILHVNGFAKDWIGQDGVLNRLGDHHNIGNQSMQFGPQPQVDKIMGWLYPYWFPYLFTFRIDGVLYFTPIIWILPFLYLATYIVGPLLALPFEHRQMRLDVEEWKQRRKMRRQARK